VLAGGRDMTARPPLCGAVAELIPGAQYEVMEEEAHQPFQEVPDEWNNRASHNARARHPLGTTSTRLAWRRRPFPRIAQSGSLTTPPARDVLQRDE
jgi:hypothetical protein